MYRVTTPTHTFKMPLDTSNYDVIKVKYEQGSTTLVKTYENETLPSGMTFDGHKVLIELTQTETKAFREGVASVQVRALTTTGKVFASKIFTVAVQKVLDEEVLE